MSLVVRINLNKCSLAVSVALRGIFGNIWKHFLAVTRGSRGGLLLASRLGARDAVKHPTMHRPPPHSKELSGPNINSVMVEKL